MADVNAAVRTKLIRRAIERTRFENEVLKEIRAIWRQVIPQILLAVRTAGIHEKGAGTVTRLAIGGNAGGNMRLGDQRQRLAEVMAGIATLWRAAVADATRRLRGNLKQFVELEMLELPTSVQAVLEKNVRKQESAFMEYSPDQPRDPAGSATGGQWASGGEGQVGGGGGSRAFDPLAAAVPWTRRFPPVSQDPPPGGKYEYHSAPGKKLADISARGLRAGQGEIISVAPHLESAVFWGDAVEAGGTGGDQVYLLRMNRSDIRKAGFRIERPPDDAGNEIPDHDAGREHALVGRRGALLLPGHIEIYFDGTWTSLRERVPYKRAAQEAADDDLDPFAPRIDVRFNSLPAAQMSELLTSPLGGANFAQSFEDLSTRVLTKLRNVLSGGLLRGEGVPKVTRAVKGLLDGTRWEAERIVRSEYVRVAGQAALIQFDGNKELLDGVRWVSALDDRTCLQCGDMDGEEWEDATDAPVPVTDTHPNCRCVIVPVVKDLPGFAFGPSTRASQDGPVSGKETFTTWFPQQDAAFQRATLGPTRYKLFKAGALKLGDFSTAAGTRSVADALALAKRRGN